ncbi:MAG: hypothetical protein R3C59_09905 [Planctomycetaceae bacterium]
MEDSVESLEAMVGSDAALGIRQVDGYAAFPDGTAAAICTHCARRVIEVVGSGEVWGFSVRDNPEAVSAEGCDGHDFAIIDHRLLVDVWLSVFAGEVARSVYDLHSGADAAVIARLYGDRRKWQQLPAVEQISWTIWQVIEQRCGNVCAFGGSTANAHRPQPSERLLWSGPAKDNSEAFRKAKIVHPDLDLVSLRLQ